MGTKLNKAAYSKIIQENIDELNKFMPENSLEKNHTIDVLKDSINYYYPIQEAKTTEEEKLKNEIKRLTLTLQKRTEFINKNPFKKAYEENRKKKIEYHLKVVKLEKYIEGISLSSKEQTEVSDEGVKDFLIDFSRGRVPDKAAISRLRSLLSPKQKGGKV